MIDHLMSFADEATAHAALDALGYGGKDASKTPFWDQSRCVPNVSKVYAAVTAAIPGTARVSPVFAGCPDGLCHPAAVAAAASVAKGA